MQLLNRRTDVVANASFIDDGDDIGGMMDESAIMFLAGLEGLFGGKGFGDVFSDGNHGEHLALRVSQGRIAPAEHALFAASSGDGVAEMSGKGVLGDSGEKNGPNVFAGGSRQKHLDIVTIKNLFGAVAGYLEEARIGVENQTGGIGEDGDQLEVIEQLAEDGSLEGIQGWDRKIGAVHR